MILSHIFVCSHETWFMSDVGRMETSVQFHDEKVSFFRTDVPIDGAFICVKVAEHLITL